VNNLSEKTLVLAPHRLFSLWDMTEILPEEFTGDWRKLDAALAACAPPASSDTKQPRQETANPTQQQALANLLTDLWNVCKKLNLKESLFIVEEARQWLVDPHMHAVWSNDPATPGAYKHPKEIPPTDFPSIYKQLVSIRRKIYEELSSIRFALIAADKVGVFEQDALFGEAFHKSASPEINAEIKAAGNCLAVDLNMATVFHLMRAVELVLRKFVPYLQSKGFGISVGCPLRFATWKRILDAINAELGRTQETPTSAAREEEKQFYSQISAEIRAFQYLWRDPVMHARCDEPPKAGEIFNHVKRFMLELAPRVPLK
jgi:hypothetical protein